jgi:hypothetical protein
MNTETKDKLLELLKYAASRLRYLTADNLRLLVEHSGAEQISPSSYGQVMRKAQAKGIISPTDKAEISRYRGANSIRRVLWKSNISRCRNTEGRSGK